MATPPDPRLRDVDDLRQQLRSLGYLDAGVDRFVLGPAHATRRPAAIALLASLRIGALAAVLLGPAAAIGVAARMPGLITGARDGFVVASYLGALFGAASFVAESGAGAGGGRSRRPVRRYRTTRRSADGRRHLHDRLSGLPDALVGRVDARGGDLRLAFRLDAAAGRAGSRDQPAARASRHRHHARRRRRAQRRRRRRARRAGFVAPRAGCGGCADLRRRAAPAHLQRARGSRARRSAGAGGGVERRQGTADCHRRIRYRHCRAVSGNRGQIPAIGALFDGAVARLDSGDTRDPARTWTTIATGQLPDRHGVHALETRRVAGVEGTLATADRSPLARSIDGVTDCFV